MLFKIRVNMKSILHTTLLIIFFGSFGCITPSEQVIDIRDSPDLDIQKKFNIDTKGEIVHQFYQSYGWDDKMEQLIMIFEKKQFSVFAAKLPMDSIQVSNLRWVNKEKFNKQEGIDYKMDQYLHADIRLESFLFDDKSDVTICKRSGEYTILSNDTLETIMIRDSQSDLLYIESVKCVDCR